VLTSGGRPTAAEGTAMLAALIARGGEAITVVAGGRVRAETVAALLWQTGVREVHARVIREPAPADALMRERWRRDVAALTTAATSGSSQTGDSPQV
jgi:copper homeostasis protein CutC